jgi:hypothetical protein
MSLPEQGAKVATSVVDAMRGQPMMLAVLVLNAVMLLVIFYGVRHTRETEAVMIGKLIEQNAKAQELLAKCVVPRSINLMAEAIPI